MQSPSFSPELLPALQSILTGESSSVEKHLESTHSRKAVYQDKTCLLFAVRLSLLSVRVIPCQALACIECHSGKVLQQQISSCIQPRAS